MNLFLHLSKTNRVKINKNKPLLFMKLHSTASPVMNFSFLL